MRNRKVIVLGKKVVSRKETIEYSAQKFEWKNCVIGISCYFGFWAWILGRLTRRKVIYYCIDFYSPKIAKNLWDKVFIWCAMQMDKFLVKHADICWDISGRINQGRFEFGKYQAYFSKVVPLSYPPNYFRYETKNITENIVAFVGLDPYGLELAKDIKEIQLVWLGQHKLLPLDKLLGALSICGIGISLWKEKGNNYYGDPGKTKLYSACGLPVIMTDNTPYACIIKETMAGIVIPYEKQALEMAIKRILFDYNFYKRNVKDTWKYINADEICRDIQLLG